MKEKGKGKRTAPATMIEVRCPCLKKMINFRLTDEDPAQKRTCYECNRAFYANLQQTGGIKVDVEEANGTNRRTINFNRVFNSRA